MNDLLTIEDAAEYLKVPRGLLARMRYERTGPRYYKPSPKTIRYTREDLDEWVRRSQIEPGEL